MNPWGNNRRALFRNYGSKLVKYVKDPWNFFTEDYKRMAPLKRNSTSTYPSPPRTPKRKTKTGTYVVKPYSIKPKPKRSSKPIRRKIFAVGQRRIQRKTQVKGLSTGTYQGKFATPSGLKKTFETTGNRLGFVAGKEVHGLVEDPDCVYIYHTPYEVSLTVTAICGALCRTLLRKAGIEVGNQKNELLFNSYDNSSGATFLFTFQNIQGNTTSYFVTVANDWDFDRLVLEVSNQSIAGKIGYQFKDYLLGNNPYMPYSMSLYFDDSRNADGTSFTTRLAAHVTLGDEYMVLQQYSCLTIQNRTKGSNAADYDADRIDNQPLKGKIYQFKNADPRLKTQQRGGTGMVNFHEQVYSSGDTDAIRAFGGTADFPATAHMNEPPEPTLWRNIDKTSNISLEPGAMKKCMLVTEYKYRLPTIMNKLKVDHFSQSNNMKSFQGLHGGKSQIIALEEQLATPGDNFITCIYEQETKVSAYTYTKKLKGTLKTVMAKGTNSQWTPPV